MVSIGRTGLTCGISNLSRHTIKSKSLLALSCLYNSICSNIFVLYACAKELNVSGDVSREELSSKFV